MNAVNLIDRLGTWLLIIGLVAVMAYESVLTGQIEPNAWMLAFVTLLLGRLFPKPGEIGR